MEAEILNLRITVCSSAPKKCCNTTSSTSPSYHSISEELHSLLTIPVERLPRAVKPLQTTPHFQPMLVWLWSDIKSSDVAFAQSPLARIVNGLRPCSAFPVLPSRSRLCIEDICCQPCPVIMVELCLHPFLAEPPSEKCTSWQEGEEEDGYGQRVLHFDGRNLS